MSAEQHDEILAAVTKALNALTETGDTQAARDVIMLAIHAKPDPDTEKTLRRIKDYLSVDAGQKAKFHLESLFKKLTQEFPEVKTPQSVLP